MNYIFLILLGIIAVSIPQAFAHDYELEKPVMCSFVEYNGNCYPELYFTIDTENRAPAPYDTWIDPPKAVVGKEMLMGCYALETVESMSMELKIYDDAGNVLLASNVADESFDGWPSYTFEDSSVYTIECHAHNYAIYVEQGIDGVKFEPVIVLRDILIPQSLESVEERKSKSEISKSVCESDNDKAKRVNSCD